METGTTGNLHSRAQLGIAPGTGTGSQTTTSTSAGGATPLVPGSPRVLQADTKAGTPGKQPTVASAGGSRLNRRVDDRPPPDRLPPLRGSDQGWLPWLRSFFFTLPAPQPAVSLLEDHKGWDIDRDPPLDRDPLQIIGAYVATPELIDLMTQDSGVPADKVDMGLVDTKAVMASMTLEDFQRHARRKIIGQGGRFRRWFWCGFWCNFNHRRRHNRGLQRIFQTAGIAGLNINAACIVGQTGDTGPLFGCQAKTHDMGGEIHTRCF